MTEALTPSPPTLRRWAGVAAAALALLACALPWHQALGKKAYFAIAPDFRPSVLDETTVCTVASHWPVLLIALAALALQALLAARWPRQRAPLAIGTLVTALVAMGVVPLTAISGHGLFHRIQAMAGQILYLVAAFLLAGAALVQIVSRARRSAGVDPPPPVDPPPS